MEIIHHDGREKGVFKAKNETVKMGEMTYVWVDKHKIIIDHTGVDPDFEGNGIGTQLIMKAVDFARDKNIKIMPHCPFAKKIFMKDKNIADVLA
ncbi:MAG: N-acetyltransferase [Bacteroidales bacterium]|jgi:predicted GNAT family acetyltransferase|nr:N-acetyltransferase [Bacteroidales bacterium]